MRNHYSSYIEMIIVKFCNALSNKFGGFLSKIIHATGRNVPGVLNCMSGRFIDDICLGEVYAPSLVN